VSGVGLPRATLSAIGEELPLFLPPPALSFCGVLQGFCRAAGLGFEPRLTDPESVSIHPSLFTAVQKSAILGLILKARVSRCSQMFTPVTVKSLSKEPGTFQLSFDLHSPGNGVL
jgi:hypothetical protein